MDHLDCGTVILQNAAAIGITQRSVARPHGRLFHATLTDQRDISEAEEKLKLEKTQSSRNNNAERLHGDM